MIFTKHGSEVKLISYCGMYDNRALYRALVTFMPDTEQQSARKTFVFIDDLHTDMTTAQLILHLDLVPDEVLSETALKKAIIQAS